jgi:hypothetical protein
MFDIDALLAAGFEKLLSDEEWAATSTIVPLVDYRLVRGNVMVSTERNTQDQDNNGLQTTVRYPEIAVIQHLDYVNRRVSCESANTELILLLADEIDQNTSETRRNRREGNFNG